MTVGMKSAIVLLSYNHPELTATALRSIQAFSGPVIYLVHNGSEVKFRKRLMLEFPDLHHLVIEKNRGFSGGANFGLREVFLKHEWAIFLTNDCLPLSLPSLDSAPAFIAPNILLRNTDRTDSVGGGFHPGRAHLFHCKSPEQFSELLNSSQTVKPYVPGSAFALHRDVYALSGGFDEELGTYWEDVDLSLKIHARGGLIKHDMNWQIRHKVGKTCHKHREYTLYLFQRNRKRISLRYARTMQKPMVLLHLTMSWLQLSVRLFRQRRGADLRLLWRALCD